MIVAFTGSDRFPAPTDILWLEISPGAHLSPICHSRCGTLSATRENCTEGML
jgi:hypothetical protein